MKRHAGRMTRGDVETACPHRAPQLNRAPGLLVLALLLTESAVAGEKVDFVRDVMPAITKAGCNGGKCHGSFQGRGGLRLSLLGFDPEVDYDALVKQGRGRRISLASPGQSLMLQKPLGRVPHLGGKRFEEHDEAYQVLYRWLAAGANPPGNPQIAVERIEVTPGEFVLSPRQSDDLHVIAVWNDGVSRDITEWASYESRDESCAEVSVHGSVTAVSSGRSAITVTYMGQVAAVTVTVPYGNAAQVVNFVPANFIDELISKEWRKLGLTPEPIAGDYEFARRVFLDITGTLPTRDEIEAFVASNDPNKRSVLIDELLQRPEYVDYWATKWADLFRVHRRYVGDKGLWTFWNWVRTAVRENWPADRLAREILTSRGSLFTNGATAYYYVDAKPEELAETTSQLFLGVRLQCARCHHHPYEVWSQEDYYGLANAFTRMELKDNGDGGRYGGAKLLRTTAKPNRDRRVAMQVEPSAFGNPLASELNTDVREQLAEWITADDNPFFVRSFVNRYWSYFMSRGIVEPVDDLRATNPPSHPELLVALADEFTANGKDFKQLIRTICNSRVYQLAGNPAPHEDRDGMFYTHHRFRRISAAVLLDAVSQATGTEEEFAGLPKGTRAIALPDPAIPSYFLDTFGRSVRNSPCECATSEAPDLSQALHLLNSDDLSKKIRSSGGRIQRLSKEAVAPSEAVDDLYYATFGRPASVTEKEVAVKLLETSTSPQEGLEDLLWVLLNSTEFVFNH
ncbi:MAG: DUF1549 domain-containing protein [Planctomycetaceae bacterium]|nr:DUF1549 domain-containing protein [Planctomycetales bacterium]MCB9927355.1 DUF1549 domain-containing protein [Planctomycetaceae bacterium]